MLDYWIIKFNIFWDSYIQPNFVIIYLMIMVGLIYYACKKASAIAMLLGGAMFIVGVGLVLKQIVSLS